MLSIKSMWSLIFIISTIIYLQVESTSTHVPTSTPTITKEPTSCTPVPVVIFKNKNNKQFYNKTFDALSAGSFNISAYKNSQTYPNQITRINQKYNTDCSSGLGIYGLDNSGNPIPEIQINEIPAMSYYVQFDFGNIRHNYNMFSIGLSGIDLYEGYQLYGSNNAGELGTLLYTSPYDPSGYCLGNFTYKCGKQYRYMSITAIDLGAYLGISTALPFPNILVQSVTFMCSSTPYDCAPTAQPSFLPTFEPSYSHQPSVEPTYAPSSLPTELPTYTPSATPTYIPSYTPSSTPTYVPSNAPSDSPSFAPSSEPSVTPTLNPTVSPSMLPTIVPSNTPSINPTLSYEPTSCTPVPVVIFKNKNNKQFYNKTFDALSAGSFNISAYKNSQTYPNQITRINQKYNTDCSSGLGIYGLDNSGNPIPEIQINEIPAMSYYVQFDFGNIRHNYNMFSIGLSGIDLYEGYQLYGSNNAGELGTLLYTSAYDPSGYCLGNFTYKCGKQYRYMSITAIDLGAYLGISTALPFPNILVQSVTFMCSSTPYDCAPTAQPSFLPTFDPSYSHQPSVEPTYAPSSLPTELPTYTPSATPTYIPSYTPSSTPTYVPSNAPSDSPSFAPSSEPSVTPTLNPTVSPSMLPTIVPSNTPSINPTLSYEPTSCTPVPVVIFKNKNNKQFYNKTFDALSAGSFNISAYKNSQTYPNQITRINQKYNTDCSSGLGIYGLDNSGNPIPEIQINEIPAMSYYVQFDFGNIRHNYNMFSIGLSGIDLYEGYQLYGSNNAGELGTLLYTSAYDPSGYCLGNFTYKCGKQYRYMSITAIDLGAYLGISTALPFPNILVQSVTFMCSSTPYDCAPTAQPSFLPTFDPSYSHQPSVEPTYAPSSLPSALPSYTPSATPTYVPSYTPSITPTYVPSNAPSDSPSFAPSSEPSVTPTLNPTVSPSMLPTIVPSNTPSINPTLSYEPTSCTPVPVVIFKNKNNKQFYNKTFDALSAGSFNISAYKNSQTYPNQITRINQKYNTDCSSGLGIYGLDNSGNPIPEIQINEIPAMSYYVQFDFGNIRHNYNMFSIGLSGIDLYEGYQLYGSNNAGELGTLLYTSAYDPSGYCLGNFTYKCGKQYRYMSITAIDLGAYLGISTALPFPNILVQSVTFMCSSTPYDCAPTAQPSFLPTFEPSYSHQPSVEPTYAPSSLPSVLPTYTPSATPTYVPSYTPSNIPTYVPSNAPSDSPSFAPSSEPSVTPTLNPTVSPSMLPTIVPSNTPSINPTLSYEPTSCTPVPVVIFKNKNNKQFYNKTFDALSAGSFNISAYKNSQTYPNQITRINQKYNTDCSSGLGIYGLDNSGNPIPEIQINEIPAMSYYVQFDFGNIRHNYNMFSIGLSGIDLYEGYQLYGSNNAGELGTLLYTSAYDPSGYCLGNFTYKCGKQYRYMSITAIDLGAYLGISTALPFPNILVQSVTFMCSSTPYDCAPTAQPSFLPTFDPSYSHQPSVEPTYAPSSLPSALPSYTPSATPTYVPSYTPSITPTYVPSNAPSDSPSFAPSSEPSVTPTLNPTVSPSMLPTIVPSNTPSINPTLSYEPTSCTPVPVVIFKNKNNKQFYNKTFDALSAGSFNISAYKNSQTYPNQITRINQKYNTDCSSGLGIYGLDNSGNPIPEIQINEIPAMSYYVQFDFGNIRHNYNMFSIGLSGIDLYEGYQLYGSNNAGELGTLLYTSAYDPSGYCLGNFTYKCGKQYRYMSITAIDLGAYLGISTALPFPNILVQSVTFMCSSTPYDCAPTSQPSFLPTFEPSYSHQPSVEPTYAPSSLPTVLPTYTPSATPTYVPSYTPSNIPTYVPSNAPSDSPSFAPSSEPSVTPTLNPTVSPSMLPTIVPSNTPSINPTLSYEPTSCTPVPVVIFKNKNNKQFYNKTFDALSAGTFNISAYKNSQTYPNQITRINQKYNTDCSSGLGIYGLDNSGNPIPEIQINEIPAMSYYVQFDFGNIRHNYNMFSIGLSGIDLYEGYQLYGSNNAGELGTLLYTSPYDPSGYCLGNFTYKCGKQYRYMSITAIDLGAYFGISTALPFPNILVQSVTFMCSSTPYDCAPTSQPSFLPTFDPSYSHQPSVEPTYVPSSLPTERPTYTPSVTPTYIPSYTPSSTPTYVPSNAPSDSPSFAPSSEPSVTPTLNPTVSPSMLPTIVPSNTPSINPTLSYEPTSCTPVPVVIFKNKNNKQFYNKTFDALSAGTFNISAYKNSQTYPNQITRINQKYSTDCSSGLGIYGLDNSGNPIPEIQINEIPAMSYYVQFDFGNIRHNYNMFSIGLSGIDLYEGYQLYGSNNAGELGTLLYTSAYDPSGYCLGNFTYKCGKQYRYMSITAIDLGAYFGISTALPFPNILVQSVTFMCSSTPYDCAPTAQPSFQPSNIPSVIPSFLPSVPSFTPSLSPSVFPSYSLKPTSSSNLSNPPTLSPITSLAPVHFSVSNILTNVSVSAVDSNDGRISMRQAVVQSINNTAVTINNVVITSISPISVTLKSLNQLKIQGAIHQTQVAYDIYFVPPYKNSVESLYTILSQNLISSTNDGTFRKNLINAALRNHAFELAYVSFVSVTVYSLQSVALTPTGLPTLVPSPSIVETNTASKTNSRYLASLIGGIIGGIVFLCLMVIIIWYFVIKSHRSIKISDLKLNDTDFEFHHLSQQSPRELIYFLNPFKVFSKQPHGSKVAPLIYNRSDEEKSEQNFAVNHYQHKKSILTESRVDSQMLVPFQAISQKRFSFLEVSRISPEVTLDISTIYNKDDDSDVMRSSESNDVNTNAICRQHAPDSPTPMNLDMFAIKPLLSSSAIRKSIMRQTSKSVENTDSDNSRSSVANVENVESQLSHSGIESTVIEISSYVSAISDASAAGRLLINPTEQLPINSTKRLSINPNERLSIIPTERLSTNPTERLSTNPTEQLSIIPTERLSTNPTERLSTNPAETNPNERLSTNPTERLSTNPTERLSTNPAERLSTNPTERLSANPNERLSTNPTERLSINRNERLPAIQIERLSTNKAQRLTTNPAERLLTNQADRLANNSFKQFDKQQSGLLPQAKTITNPNHLIKESSIRHQKDAPSCAVCCKAVYQAEKVQAIGRVWHKTCFKCGGTSIEGGCGKVLGLDKYVDHNGDPFCRLCHSKNFGNKGTLTEGIKLH